MYFVWIKGQKHNYCEIWHGDLVTGTDKFKHGPVVEPSKAVPGDLLFFTKIDEFHSLEQLAITYPCPKRSST